MNLATALDACQANHVNDWRMIPDGGPGTDLLVGLVDIGTREEPALTALPHLHRAVYVPDPRLGIGWGMETQHTLSWRGQEPDWIAPGWNSVEPLLAHVLLNGTMIWRTTCAQIDLGSGSDGILPWPSREFEERAQLGDEYPPVGWSTSRWDVEFAKLLNDLCGNDLFRFDDELHGWGLQIDEQPPLGSPDSQP